MISAIDHIGIAVVNLDEAIGFYEKALGFKCESIEEVPTQKVKVAFFDVGGVHIELLEPTDPSSPIAKFLEKNPKGGIHHIAYKTNDVAAQLSVAKEAGVSVLHETPVPGAHDTLVAFLHPKSTFGVLTEFCQHQH